MSRLVLLDFSRIYDPSVECQTMIFGSSLSLGGGISIQYVMASACIFCGLKDETLFDGRAGMIHSGLHGFRFCVGSKLLEKKANSVHRFLWRWSGFVFMTFSLVSGSRSAKVKPSRVRIWPVWTGISWWNMGPR